MNRADITELHFITPIANIPSILRHGILSHQQADRLAHESIAMADVQKLRRNKQIPGARSLHEYVNMYFDAHNPMLSRLRDQNNSICVLRIAPDVLELPGVIIADRNASSAWVKFMPAGDGLSQIVRDRVFAKYWTHPNDPYEEMSHKSEKCAEVLVPDSVDSAMLLGAYLAHATVLSAWQAMNVPLPATIKRDMFF